MPASRRSHRPRAIALIASGLCLSACAAEPPETTRGAVAYGEVCGTCHGARADGAGPLSGLVPGGVPDLTGLAARNGGVFPHAYVVDTIARGSDRHQRIVAMPDFDGLLGGGKGLYVSGRGDVVQTDRAILDIAAWLRTQQR